MPKYITKLDAYFERENEIKTYITDIITANSWHEAENWIKENKPYLTIIGELVWEISDNLNIPYKAKKTEICKN